MAHDVATLGAATAMDSARPRPWLTPPRVVAAAVVVLGVAAVVRVVGGWTPIGDHALMRLWVDAVGTGHTPLVVDAGEFLRAPAAQLGVLCEALGIPFTERMLSWPAGPRASDGVWAPYWYEAVLRSTGFAPYRGSARSVPREYQQIIDAVMPPFEALYERRLR